MEYEQFGNLKVLSYNQRITVDSVGVKKTIRANSFKGYLKAEDRKVKPAQHEDIVSILQACTNVRDQVLILLLAETGFRIGEILGVDYTKDIDYRNHMIGVYFRDDNENNARAKNAEYRKAKISDATFEFLMYYLAEYRKLLQHQTYLFINITGDTAGQALKVDTVYAMLDRMEKKTGIKITPHMLRRYFGNERRNAGWRLEMIQQALGHKHIQTTVQYLNIVDDQLLEASQDFYNKHSAIYGIDKVL
jgi:integrase